MTQLQHVEVVADGPVTHLRLDREERRNALSHDLMREMIDGSTGDRHSPSGFYGTADEDYRSAYLARVRGEIDTQDWWDYIKARGKRWS